MVPFTRVQVEKCKKCLNYYRTTYMHQCIEDAIEDPKIFRKNLPTDCIEKKVLSLSSDDDVGDNKVNDFNFTSSLISAIEVRRPLFDHRMVSSKKSELIKNELWNEVYTELQGEFTLDELKKKWKYLKEKYVRVRQQQKKSGINTRSSSGNWLHYAQLSFLEEVVTQYHDKKANSISDSNLDNNSDDFPQSFTTDEEQIRKESSKFDILHFGTYTLFKIRSLPGGNEFSFLDSQTPSPLWQHIRCCHATWPPENEHDLQRHWPIEHKMPKPTLSAELNEVPLDPDIAFGNYLVALMKDLPIKKRKKFQCQFIASVISAQESE